MATTIRSLNSGENHSKLPERSIFEEGRRIFGGRHRVFEEEDQPTQLQEYTALGYIWRHVVQTAIVSGG